MSAVVSTLESKFDSVSTFENEMGSAVEAMLRKSTYSELRNVACDHEDGVLTLRGDVPSHFLKQMAQTLAMQVARRIPVTNRIRVTPRLAVLCGRARS